ncbi:MAG: ABC transporter permease [Bacteroidota bacterium]
MAERSPKRFWRRFKQSRIAIISLIVCSFWIVMAIIGPFVVSPLPYSCELRGETIYPLWNPNRVDSLVDPIQPKLYSEIRWDTVQLENVSWALIPYGTKGLSAHKEMKPFKPQLPAGAVQELQGRFRHHLGTNREGRDILAILILGSRNALLFALIAVGIVAMLGILIGSAMGYIGDSGLAQSRGVVLGALLGIIPAWFYGFQVRAFAIEDAIGFAVVGEFLLSLMIALGILVAFTYLGHKLTRWAWWRKSLPIPLDLLLLKAIELIESLPLIMLVISLGAIFGKNVWFFMLCLGLINWTGVARLVRGEMLRVRNLDYIQAAQALGLKPRQIIWQHALPNALPAVIVVLVTSLGGAVLIESSLSFLGLVNESASWGGLLTNAREEGFENWWVIVLPGLAIFSLVISINLVGERLRDVWDPKTTE